MEPTFYDRATDQVLDAVGASPTGLSSAEAEQRLQKFGKNALAEAKKKSVPVVFLEQFKRSIGHYLDHCRYYLHAL